MAIKPILFNTRMVQAILEGRKTQTRRLVKQPPVFGDILHDQDGWYYEDGTRNGHSLIPSFSPGDILWVRETWSTHYDGIHDDLQFCYKADGIDLQAECMPGESNRWYPSIHMPKEAARIFLKVNNVRAERLHDITFEEVEAEGTDMDAWYKYDEWQHQVGDGCVADGITVTFETLRGFYGHSVWDMTMQSEEQYEKYVFIKGAKSEQHLQRGYAAMFEAISVAFCWIRENGYDPAEIMKTKHEYNRTRPYKHGGKVC